MKFVMKIDLPHLFPLPTERTYFGRFLIFGNDGTPAAFKNLKFSPKEPEHANL
jgi:hypothetical protein